jgi:hypothetical protein
MAKRSSATARLGVDALFTAVPARAAEAEPKNVKVTFYITPAQDLKLEKVRLARLERGERVDKSTLVREAIDALED